nr:uncharacterized protein LOC111414755 [Onthophagus taurus]XP_022915288.1 uncharacterized protein LOC111425477 [Onthophagus taurus]
MKVLNVFSTYILCNILSHMGVTPTLTPSPTPQVVKFYQLMQRYQKYMENPLPKEMILWTRDLLPKSLRTKRVYPIFIIANQCPASVGLPNFQKPCFAANSKHLKVPVVVYNPNLTKVMLNVSDHLKCACGSKFYPITTSQIIQTILPTFPTKSETNSGDAIYFSILILIVSQLYLIYLFI